MKMHGMRLLALSACACLALAGCSSSSTNNDSGNNPDSGTTPDSGNTPDSGSGNNDGGTVYVATLTGAQETPPNVSTATGSATFVLSADLTTLSYTVTHNVTGGTASHIHTNPAGLAGAVAVALTPFSTNMTGTVTLTAQNVIDLKAGRLYVNVHSGTYANGEIRGQITTPGASLYIANLTGLQETPPTTSTATGVGSVIVDSTKSTGLFNLDLTGLTPTAEHIHGELAGVGGGVVHALPTGTSVNGSLTLAAGEADTLAAGGWYMNAHTTANPNGEIRGQLLLPGESLYEARLTGAQETPPTTSTATGNGEFMVSVDQGTLRYNVETGDTNITGAHIHGAPGGQAGSIVVGFTGTTPPWTGTAALTAPQFTELDNGSWYTNVHTTVNAGGDIRGQILKPGEILFTSAMIGANEVPPVVTTGTGSFALILSPDKANVHGEGAAVNLTSPASASHIHAAAAGANGGVAYTIVHTDSGNDAGLSLASTAITATDLTNLLATGWYTNVHTSTNPNGEIRGQLKQQ
jgi:hypothetical protein